MSDAADDSGRQREAIRKHEGLDAETIVEDAEQLFAPDNKDQKPPPSPDTPPP